MWRDDGGCGRGEQDHGAGTADGVRLARASARPARPGRARAAHGRHRAARGSERRRCCRLGCAGRAARTAWKAQDLRFADQDATILQHAAGLGLTLSRSRSWSPGPKGWAIGLRFAALALRSGDDPQGFIARFTGREEAVAGYLTGEVMTRLPAQSHQLLRVAAGVMSAAGKRGEADITSPVWSGRAHACGGKRLLPAP